MIDLSKLTNRTKFRIEKELGFDPKTNSFETSGVYTLMMIVYLKPIVNMKH